MKHLIIASWAVFQKDIQSELRTRYATHTLMLFAVSTAVAVSIGVGPLGVQRDEQWLLVQAALLWIALLFAALNALSHSFVREEETRTSLALRLTTPHLAVYLGKLLFNLVLLFVLDAIASILFLLFVRIHVENMGLFIGMLVVGSTSLTAATTILAAIIAQTNARGGLFSVLAFPLVVPVLIVAIQGTALALEGAPWQEGLVPLQTLGGYTVATFVASLMLFRSVWET